MGCQVGAPATSMSRLRLPTAGEGSGRPGVGAGQSPVDGLPLDMDELHAAHKSMQSTKSVLEGGFLKVRAVRAEMRKEKSMPDLGLSKRALLPSVSPPVPYVSEPW